MRFTVFLSKWLPEGLGILLLYSGGYKLVFPGEATFALLALDVPVWLAKETIFGVTILEIYLGLILLFGLNLRYALGFSMGVFLAFTIFLSYLSTMASPPSCGCMGLTGMFDSNRHNALLGIFRNCVILWLLKMTYDYYGGEGGMRNTGPG